MPSRPDLALNCAGRRIGATGPLQAQSLYEIWEVELFYALFDWEGRRNLENPIRQLGRFAAVAQQTRPEERVEQESSD